MTSGAKNFSQQSNLIPQVYGKSIVSILQIGSWGSRRSGSWLGVMTRVHVSWTPKPKLSAAGFSGFYTWDGKNKAPCLASRIRMLIDNDHHSDSPGSQFPCPASRGPDPITQWTQCFPEQGWNGRAEDVTCFRHQKSQEQW